MCERHTTPIRGSYTCQWRTRGNGHECGSEPSNSGCAGRPCRTGKYKTFGQKSKERARKEEEDNHGPHAEKIGAAVRQPSRVANTAGCASPLFECSRSVLTGYEKRHASCGARAGEIRICCIEKISRASSRRQANYRNAEEVMSGARLKRRRQRQRQSRHADALPADVACCNIGKDTAK